MARRAWIRRTAVIGLALAIWACEDIAEPVSDTISLEIQPSLQGSAAQFAGAADNLRITIEMRTAGTFNVVADTTVAIDPLTGEATADVSVPLIQDPQTYRVTLRAQQSNGTVLFSGTTEIAITRANASQTTNVTVPVEYVGPAVAQLIIVPRDTVVQPGANFTLAVTAIDSAGATTAAPPVTFSLLNPTSLVTVDASTGAVAVVSGAISGVFVVQATTPDGVFDYALIQVGNSFPPVRRRWVVDPAIAFQWPLQFGTDAYPFSTIARGMARAQIRDTVFLAVNTYLESINGTRPVVLLGDSTAAGVPVITPPNNRNSIFSPTGPVEVKRIKFQGTNAGLDIRATALNVTSTQFQGISGQALLITQSGFTTINGITITGITGGSLGRGIQMFAGASLTIRNANIIGTDDAAIRVDSVGVVNIVRTDIQQASLANDIIYGIELVFVDSALIDTTKVHNTNGGGIAGGGIRTLTARADTITSTFVNTVDPLGLTANVSFFLLDVLNSRVINSAIINNNAGGILVRDSAVDATASIQNTRVDGAYWGIWAETILGTGSISNISITNSIIRGRRNQTRGTAGVVMQGMQSATITGSTIDSITGWGVYVGDNSSVTMSNNVLRDIDSIVGSPFIYPIIHSVDNGTGRFTNNQLRRNGSAAFLFDGRATDILLTGNIIDSNVVGIRLDTANTVGVDMVTANSNQITNQRAQGILTLQMGGNFQANNIFGNGFGVDNQTQSQIVLDARNSWWGDVLGPSCGVGATDCNGQSLGNPVSVNVTVTPFATAPVTPPLSAPMFAGTDGAAAAVRMLLEENRQAVAPRIRMAPGAVVRGYTRR